MARFGNLLRRFVLGQETLWNIYRKDKTIPKGLIVICPDGAQYVTGEQEYCAAMDLSGILLYPDPARGGPIMEPLLVESELKKYVVVGSQPTSKNPCPSCL